MKDPGVQMNGFTGFVDLSKQDPPAAGADKLNLRL